MADSETDDPSARGCASQKKTRQSNQWNCLDLVSNTKLSGFIGSVAELPRVDDSQSDYGELILPFTVLRRFNCIRSLTKAAVLEENARREVQGLELDPFMLRKAWQGEIMLSIQEKRSETDALKIKAFKSTQPSKKHHSALISAAATGQIGVRGLAPEKEVA